MTRTVTRILVGDVRDRLRSLPDGSVHCCVTSPPYWGLRDYGVDGQIGLEATPEEWCAALVGVFGDVHRVLRDDGTLWLNVGDSYASVPAGGGWNWDKSGLHGGAITEKYGQTLSALSGQKRNTVVGDLKPKDLIGQPWMVAFALREAGWWLRADIVWQKPNPMPESIRDRPTKAHEYVFLLAKSRRYYFDGEAVREPATCGNHHRNVTEANRTPERGAVPPGAPKHRGLWKTPGPGAGRNIRSVWSIPTEPCPEAHFATFPQRLVEPCVRAGTSDKGCCPRCGAPWHRVVERAAAGDWNDRDVADDHVHRNRNGQATWDAYTPPRTTGWQPGCECVTDDPAFRGTDDYDPVPLDPVPCTVLDPFGGSGTVGVVAGRLGRHAVLVELNPGYATDIAAPRIRRELGPLFHRVEVTTT